MYTSYGLFIDGKWCPGSETEPVISPATGESIGDAPVASAADTERAIAAAERGLAEWRQQTPLDRSVILHAIADEMVRRTEDAVQMISTETGKPLAQSQREWGLSLDQFRWQAEETRRIYGRIVEGRTPGARWEILHEPVGVVAAFTAWNFPAVLVARKVAPALAAGCAIVVRPSSRTPGSAMVLFECMRAVEGLPTGVINLVNGPTAATYQPLMASPAVRKVSLTGSTRVGQQMIRDAADTVKRVSMELGGNAPIVVFEDADLELALDSSAMAKFANAGQVCVAPDRFYIHDKLHDQFVEGFAKRAAALKLGDGLDESVQMGPLIAPDRFEETSEVVAEAVADGATVVTGGGRATQFNAGNFFQPTVLRDVPDSTRAMAEENFAPVAAITRFEDAEDAYARANSSPMGLAAYTFTRDAKRAREAVAELNAGMVGVNSFALAAAEAPFGGIRYSGMGREGGSEGIMDYLNIKLAQMTV